MLSINPAHPRPTSDLGLVTTVQARGRGIIILSGPSSCGKGAIASAISRTLHLPEQNHISAGDALRRIVKRAHDDDVFRSQLETRFGISAARSIFDHDDENLVAKAKSYDDFTERFGPEPSEVNWLEYCVSAGLLAPDEWSERVIEGTMRELADQPQAVIVVDGYPRTEAAALHILNLSDQLNLPIIKVIHLSVSKREMIERALGRKRLDDTPEMLERRYEFYVDYVQPSVELLKDRVGAKRVALIDAHQPERLPNGELDLAASVKNVAHSVLTSLGVSRHILRTLQPHD